MALARNGDVWLHWREEGDPGGVPIVLIMGLNGSGRAWFRLVPHLRERCRVILPDNRGTGDSDPVRGPLTMADMVGDVLAVLDAAGLERAHVMGASMGGMIAQHLALDHRDRVASLVLACTTPGGRSGAPPWRLLGAIALRPVLGLERSWPLVAPALLAQRTRDEQPERVREDLAVRMADATGPRTSWAQIAAIARHDTRPRLAELAGLPVTVLHGAEDVLVPPDRGRELAAGIPGARLEELGSCGHLITTDREQAAAALVLEHLEACASRQRSAA